jgi:hypothetical protein
MIAAATNGIFTSHGYDTSRLDRRLSHAVEVESLSIGDHHRQS